MTPKELPDEIRQFFQEERPWGTDQNLRQVYVRNFHRIRDTESINRRSKIFLRYLNHSHSLLIETIAHVLEDIFRRQTNAFKINMSFSFILQHRETGELGYHYPSNNDQLLNSPRLIRNQHDLDTLLDFLASQDFPSHLMDQPQGGGGHFNFVCTGVCGHRIGKLTHPQTKAGPSINKNTPILRLFTTEIDQTAIRFIQFRRKPPIPR